MIPSLPEIALTNRVPQALGSEAAAARRPQGA
jgi:hypothetical protein